MPETLQELPPYTPSNNENDNLLRSQEFSDSRDGINFNFILYEHTIDNADEVAKALGESDIVAIEFFGPNQQQREDYQKLANNLTHARPDTLQHSLAIQLLETSNISDFQKQLYKKLAGTNKEVVMVDIGNDSPIYKEQMAALEDFKNFGQSLYDGSPLPDIEAKFVKAVDSQAISASKREVAVVEQVKDIVNTKINKGERANIAVLQGMVHTSTSHRFFKQKNHIQRSFIPAHEGSSLKAIFTYWGECLRRREYFPDKALPEDLIDRSILEWYSTSLLDVLKREMTEHEGQMVLRKFISKLDKSEVQSLLTATQEASASPIPKEEKQQQVAKAIAYKFIEKSGVSVK